MASFMRMSALYAPTLKEEPVEAEIASHRLLLRAGMIRRLAAGIYTYLPLGYRVIRKIEQIVREEMDGIGSQEILMPIIQPAEIWHESGRWDVYGPELMRLVDRHDRDFALGPTHEEVITNLVKDELRSYKELPVCMYQIQTKFRDEIRPRFGLLRTREFVMKDAYSFDVDRAGLDESYNAMHGAYGRICERLGLHYRPVEADPGQIGGSETVEFMALADSGEASIAYCDCGYAANDEAATAEAAIVQQEVGERERIATPECGTIAELADLLGVPEAATVKAMVGVDEKGITHLFFIPGSHDLNELKVEAVAPGFQLASAEQIEAAGLVKGYIGPIDVPAGVQMTVDSSLKNQPSWICGAGEEGYHFINAVPGRDFEVERYADLILTKAGDICPRCGAPLEQARGIEVSQVFKLGTKYSEVHGATFADQDGVEHPFHMGCYGVGISRSMAAIVEQRNDENGISWPLSVAPYHVHILPLSADDVVITLAQDLAQQLADAGVEVLLDDRDERAGVKFADADLIGIPYQIIVGKRGAAAGELEFKTRSTMEKQAVPVADIVDVVTQMLEA